MPAATDHSAAAEPPFLRRARLADDAPTSGYPFDLACVRDIGDLHLAQVTVLVGDNGAGKSTVLEAIAVAAGFNPEGGSRNVRFETHATHSALADHLVLSWHRRPAWGWFLRAETFYGMATSITNDPWLRGTMPALHDESHGESFLDMARRWLRGPGLYLFDEAESALSLQGQLTLLRLIHDGCQDGAQFVLATHSPVLMSYPGAAIVECDDDGLHPCAYDDVVSVQLWRRFLADPSWFLRQVFDDTGGGPD